MTVPPSFRRGVPIPRILRLHYGNVPVAEQEILFLVLVTNALRTILDVWEEDSLPKETVRRAFRQATATGKITQRQVADSRALPARVSRGKGQTPHQYLLGLRLENAVRLMKERSTPSLMSPSLADFLAARILRKRFALSLEFLPSHCRRSL